MPLGLASGESALPGLWKAPLAVSSFLKTQSCDLRAPPE